VIVKLMIFPADFYPKHIEKEDRHFFIPIMNYFTSEEKDALYKTPFAFPNGIQGAPAESGKSSGHLNGIHNGEMAPPQEKIRILKEI